jgi:hypothetical protein
MNESQEVNGRNIEELLEFPILSWEKRYNLLHENHLYFIWLTDLVDYASIRYPSRANEDGYHLIVEDKKVISSTYSSRLLLDSLILQINRSSEDSKYVKEHKEDTASFITIEDLTSPSFLSDHIQDIIEDSLRFIENTEGKMISSPFGSYLKDKMELGLSLIAPQSFTLSKACTHALTLAHMDLINQSFRRMIPLNPSNNHEVRSNDQVGLLSSNQTVDLLIVPTPLSLSARDCVAEAITNTNKNIKSLHRYVPNRFFL